MSNIEFQSVTKAYRHRRVIDALSFTIEAGERIVLFGPSGCGKSTTLLLIAGLTPPDSATYELTVKSFRPREELSCRRSRAASAWFFKTLPFGRT